ncbi:hypothetical protein GH714_030251 [Hevea brasiliensis]|uniref:Telomerase reverse transcriptase n=1 Tax=Hevea brasiliensis TaxID=3981 RepID=A0A6A6N3L1_HEVBR|nr:hypothetical protein GH714_030251 [Hevea brasiliensis]
MRKKRRVPLVLWRLFRDRARTLATTITSLIPPHSPPPPPSCHCKGRLCLNCCGTSENVMSFLLQSRDPPDYRKLLNHCFIVVTDNAPPFAATEFRPCNNWPQHEIVIRTIEMIMREQPTSSNVICCAYDKASIFIFYCSVRCNYIKPFSRNPASKYGQMSVSKAAATTVGADSTNYKVHPNELVNPRKRSRPFRWQRCKKQKHSDIDESTSIRPSNGHIANRCVQMGVAEAATPTTGACTLKYEGLLNKRHQGLNQVIAKPKKRSRVFRWQRCKKHRHLDVEEPSDKTFHLNEDRTLRRLQYDLNNSKIDSHEKTSGFPFLSDKHSLCYLDAGVPNNVQGQNLEMHEEFLQANFYVTESEHGKQDIFYYRKSIWEKLKNRTIGCLKDQNYQCLDASDVKRIISKRLFGFSKLRLCPKENGARMLANLKAPSRMLVQESSSIGMPRKAQVCSKSVKYKHFKSVNCVLRDTHAVLKGIQLREPERLGSSVFDYNDIHKKLCLFIIGLKNELGTLPDVFIVVSDVSKAFDSIDQDKLLNVMKDVIHEDEYLLQKSSQVVCTKKSLWVHENLILADPDISTGFAKSYSARFGSLHTVLVNQGSSRYMKKRELFFNLNEHVKRNVLQLDKKFYLQGVGIPQGSILSSLLCSLYYGHLERNVIFPFLEKNYELATEDLSRRHKCQDASVAGNSSEDRISPSHCYMLLRLIDDFCFISTSKRLAAGFYTRLRRGFRDYNCYMNEEKFCLNFDARHASGLPSNRVYVGEDGISFIRWSGLLLNSCTLEVQADYTRYLNNHLRSTLTVSWQGKPGHHLKAKLCDFMRPKCHPIFFDSNINSEPVVRLNIYQSFLLCAMKFHCYVSEMLYICKLHPRYHLKTIERSLRYMYMLIKKRMLSANTGSHFHTVLQLAAEEVEWLGLNAFIKVLKRKQSQHKELLCMLKSKLLAHKINGTVSSQLSYAVDSSHSSVMWKIKY